MLGLLLAFALLATGCVKTTPHLVKIGLVAPFEGRYREIGDEVIPAVRLAIREYAGQKGQADVIVELAAYDDAGIPGRAVEQARKLAIDPEVVVVIGHWRDEATRAALPVYSQAGMPLITFSTEDVGEGHEVYNLAPSKAQMEEAADRWLRIQDLEGTLLLDTQSDIFASVEGFQQSGAASGSIVIGGPDWGLNQFYSLTNHSAESAYFVTGAAEAGSRHSDFWTDERTLQFVAGFEEGSLGAPPGLLSVTAYEATWLAISLVTGTRLEASPLETADFDERRLRDAPISLYQWEDGNRKFIEQLR